MSIRSPVACVALLISGATLLSACGGENAAAFEPPKDPRDARCFQDFGAPAASEYVLPFVVGATQTLTQGYCPTNPAWGHYDWLAYDFDTATGDTIIASRAGEVIFVREEFTDANRICGQENFVFVEHADGTVMQYVHLTLDGALVEVGDVVDQGQPIGLSGDTGCSIGPHLHTNLFKDRTNFDKRNSIPLNYRNTNGPVDAQGGLVQTGVYSALAF